MNLCDMPLFVQSTAWVDELNNTWGARCIMPYSEVNAGQLAGAFPIDLRTFYGLYREALGNRSVFYQFLCFCKILEGAFRWKVGKLFEEAKDRGIELKRSTPAVPTLDTLTPPEVKAYQGKSIADAFTTFLEPQFRHAIAHFKEDNTDPLHVSHSVARARIASALELARVFARAAIGMLEGTLTCPIGEMCLSRPALGGKLGQ